MTEQPDLPTIDASSLSASVPDRHETAGLLLAAGTSTRFGSQNKLLVEVEGDPIVCHAARTLVAASLDPVVVVLGHDAERVRAALSSLPVGTVVNEFYETGQASSLRRGIEAVRPADPDTVVVALGDMPFVSPRTIDALVRAHATGVGNALAAAHDGRRGNPVLFDACHFDALASVEGDAGGRRILLERGASVLVNVDDPGVRRDVDAPADL